MKSLRICVAAALMSGVLLWVAYGAAPSPSSVPGKDAALEYVGASGGACESNALNVRKDIHDSNDKKEKIKIYVSKDSIRVAVNLAYSCGIPFEASCAIKDNVVCMTIKNVCPGDGWSCYERCLCNYPFEFKFKKKGNVDYNYIVELVSPKESQPEIISEGKLRKN